MGRLTTHVLDTANGCPGEGILIDVYVVESNTPRWLKSTQTNSDGRCDEPILADNEFKRGVYELVFAAGDYFAARGIDSNPRFLDKVVIRFGIAEPDQHYHVPLLVSPYSYSTYRGS